MLIPVLVALVVGGFNVNSAVDRWSQADDAYRTAMLVRAAATYSHALIDERDRTVVPLLKGDDKNSAVLQARAATDDAARQFEDTVRQAPGTPDLQRRLAAFRQVQGRLPTLRQNAFTAKLPGVQTEEGYVEVQHPLMEFANDLGFGTSNITSYGRTLYAISLAKAAESLTRAIGTHILTEGPVPAAELKTQQTALASYAYLENIALEEYKGGGTPEDLGRLQDAVAAAEAKGKQQLEQARGAQAAQGGTFTAPPDRATMVKLIASGASPAALRAKGVTPQSWWAATTLGFDAYRSIESHLADQAATDAQQISSDARTNAIVNAAAVLLGVLAAFVVAGLMARAMSNRMRRLRSAAFEVAEQRLPALVDQLSRTDPGRVDTRVTPIPITTGDEIGEVARAFDQVHREAVRLAAEQAMLRGNVNAIFTNLSLRNQGLIQRQLALITDLENNEADPDQLENLFHLDHLATRMRRNGENLLVLAGEEPGRRWNQPVPLVDVVRAAASEVESYERIEISGVPETDIHGAAVTDLVHLLAELLENATSFSSPHTRVTVTATRLPDGRVMIEIHDKGIGLTAEDFADINHKLADPPTVDAEVSKRMGLFVVGRLADRHGIRVQLRPSGEQAGTTSLVMLPEPITHGGGGEEDEPGGDFQVSRRMPEHSASDFHSGEFTAAELGFDERSFEVPDDARALDPVGRSLLREERRAALDRRRGDEDAPAPHDEAAPADPSAFGGFPSPGQGFDQPQGFDQRTGFTPQPGYDQGLGQQAGFEQPGFEQAGFGQGFEQRPEYPQQGWQGAEAEYQQTSWDPGYSQGTWANRVEPESPTGAPEGVGYDTPRNGSSADSPDSATPGPDGPGETTAAGLPRRDRQRPWPPSASGAGETSSLFDGAPRSDRTDDDEWRSANDENWQRAEQVKLPKAGGVTSSGLPRRVPRANLVPGAAQQTPQGGPQVSRAPEDVRGRLSNLRRGVQQGRTAGSDTPSTPTDSQGLGPNHQER
nr:nitrate- and nitrite sensing domain-containing protein [Streptomyces sp. SID5468]